MLLGFSATTHLKLCIWSRACVRKGRITFISINDKSSNCENKTKNISKKWSNYCKAISYPRIICPAGYTLAVFHIVSVFSFIIVCSGRFCGLIVCALKFWNSAGKSPNNNHKIVSLYVRKTMISHGERVAWSLSSNPKENGGGSGILYHFSDNYDQVPDHFLTITNVRKPYACHRKKLTLA